MSRIVLACGFFIIGMTLSRTNTCYFCTSLGNVQMISATFLSLQQTVSTVTSKQAYTSTINRKTSLDKKISGAYMYTLSTFLISHQKMDRNMTNIWNCISTAALITIRLFVSFQNETLNANNLRHRCLRRAPPV